MKKLILFLVFLVISAISPVSAERSYLDFVEYSYTWTGQDPDTLWNMKRDDVKERLSSQKAFSCRSLFDSNRGKSFYLCRSTDRFSGKYRMRFYFSNAGMLEAIEFRAEDDYMQELAECYDGQIPTAQTIWQDLTARYGNSGKSLSVDNDIFTDAEGKISAHAAIGNKSYLVTGQRVRKYSFDRYSLLFIFCSRSYAAHFSAERR